MIDLDLFARFMQALPAQNYRVYILGDPDQLPSVEAGAVLGEMLKAENIAVKLNESKRFAPNSHIGRLSMAIQEAPYTNHWPDIPMIDNPVFNLDTDIDFRQTQTTNDTIYYRTLGEDTQTAENRLKKLIHHWVDAFYIQTNYIELCHQIKADASGSLIDSQTGVPCARELLDSLWGITQKARILSAERKGMVGIENLNQLVRDSLPIQDEGHFYIGQLLMLTENQSALKLYNGDCGIVLGEYNSGRRCLLLKKVSTQTNTFDIDHGDAADYVTYPLSLLPANALESAFAITIHKSQGSGYGNIMMFLPQTAGHPLMSNQMIYTGVTRTEQISITIVSSQAAFEAGCKTRIMRDTGLDINTPS